MADRDTRPLSAYEQWMVSSNLRTCAEEGISPREQAEKLRANGYLRVASAVERHTPTREEA